MCTTPSQNDHGPSWVFCCRATGWRFRVGGPQKIAFFASCNMFSFPGRPAARDPCRGFGHAKSEIATRELRRGFAHAESEIATRDPCRGFGHAKSEIALREVCRVFGHATSENFVLVCVAVPVLCLAVLGCAWAVPWLCCLAVPGLCLAVPGLCLDVPGYAWAVPGLCLAVLGCAVLASVVRAPRMCGLLTTLGGRAGYGKNRKLFGS